MLAEEIADGEVRWALTDHQGSVRDVIDNDGVILNHITYDSFGNITSESDAEVSFRFSYTGREFDEESGQYFYRARYYDAAIGRFVNEDPIGFAGGDTNLFRYVNNSPLNYVDPSGLFTETNSARPKRGSAGKIVPAEQNRIRLVTSAAGFTGKKDRKPSPGDGHQTDAHLHERQPATSPLRRTTPVDDRCSCIPAWTDRVAGRRLRDRVWF